MNEFGLGWNERVEPKDMQRFLILSELKSGGGTKGATSEIKTGNNTKTRRTVL